MKNMAYLLPFLALSACGQASSHTEAENVSASIRTATQQSQGTKASDLLKKLQKTYGNDLYGTGTHDTEAGGPDFWGGAYLNGEGRLVIQIRGDSATARRELERVAGSSDFEIEAHARYTMRELYAIRAELDKRLSAPQAASARANLQGYGVSPHAIDIELILNSPEKQKEFRETVMDSPAFRFQGPDAPVPNPATGMQSTQGITLQPAFTSYSVQAETASFILYNRSGADITYGQHHFITYQDSAGVWRELPANRIALDMACIVPDGEERELHAALHPDVHTNPAGNYRFFTDVWRGNGEKVRMMATFRLANADTDGEQPARTVPPADVLAGRSPAAYEAQRQQAQAEKTYDVVEEMPEYPGGMQEAMRFIAAHVPGNLKRKGRVIVQMTIEKDGLPGNFRILRSCGAEADSAAIGILRQMPKWKAGRHEGKAVRVRYALPVNLGR